MYTRNDAVKKKTKFFSFLELVQVLLPKQLVIFG